MFKKCMSLFTIVLLMLFIVGCDNDAPVNEVQSAIGIGTVKPNITFSDSKEITKTEVSLFFDRLIQKIDNTIIGSCEIYRELELEEITYEEARDFDKSLCGHRNRLDESLHLRNQVVELELDILKFFSENETIQSSTELEFLSSKFLIHFGDDALRFINYNQDESRFSQITFAIVDGELYVEQYNYIAEISTLGDESGTPYYNYYVYYENNYQLFDKLSDRGRQHLSTNLETSEFYYYNKIHFSTTELYYGDDAVTNSIFYSNEGGETASVASQIYEEDVFSMDYFMDVESSENIDKNLTISAFELPDWDTLKRGENGFHMYDDDAIVYPDYMIKHVQGSVVHFYFPTIVIEDYDLNSDVLIIDDISIDVSALKDNIDNLSNNYLEILEEYNVSIEKLTLNDYIDEFGYIDDIAENYLND